jgi:hypothetical protein
LQVIHGMQWLGVSCAQPFFVGKIPRNNRICDRNVVDQNHRPERRLWLPSTACKHRFGGGKACARRLPSRRRDRQRHSGEGWQFLRFCAFLLLAASWLGPSARLWADPVNWGTTANVASGGWGRMTALSNGNWLAVSTVYPIGTNSYLSILVSSNACSGWREIAQVREPGRTLDNGELMVLPNGNVLLTMRSLVNNTSFFLPVFVSTNQGRSWSYLSNIDSSNGPGGLWEPDFLLLSNGQIAVLYSNETHPGYSQIISEKVSPDNGTNWGAESWVFYQVGGGSLRPGMPQSVRMANGNYILVAEIVEIGNADVYCKVSPDGVAWSTDLGMHIPCQHAGPFVAAMPDGQVFVTSCENQVSFSRDFGTTWLRMQTPPWNLGFTLTWPALYYTSSNELAAMVTASGVNLRFGNLVPSSPWPNPFRDTFDAGTDANWTRYGGNFAFSNGAYLLNDTNTYGKSLVGSEFWTDGALETDLLISTPGNAGVVFRMTNPDYIGPDDGFGYYAGLDTGGFVILGRQSNSWNPLETAAMAVSTNAWYHLKVVMKSGLFTVFAGDMNTPKITCTDNTYSRGQLGVRAFQCNARFDNFLFTDAVPVRIGLNLTNGQLRFTWPLCPVNVKLVTCGSLLLPPGGSVIATSPSPANGQWALALPLTYAPSQFFWLEGR